MISSISKKKLHPDFIEEVKQRADIVEVVGGYTHLKHEGKEYIGLCPIHQEKSHSFTVTPSKGLAYCFGCGWGGNSIKFLMEVGRVSFRDAVLELARSANIPVRYEDGKSEYDYPEPLTKPYTPLAPVAKEEKTPAKDYTVDEWRVNRSVQRLLSGSGDAAKALAWLESRHITREMVKRYRLGLEKRVVTPDRSKPDCKEEYWAIAIFIPVPDRPGRFYVKKRVTPWLTGGDRPEYLAKWAQFGLPKTIWFAHNPLDAEKTWFTEGEWDAILLGELARQRGEKVAVACSTSGASTVPKPEQLDKLPGQVSIFYDRDKAGNKGAQKLAAALSGRATIGLVPMPDNCQVEGWDVTNAIQAGYGWEDFEAADLIEPVTKIEVTPPDENGIRFKVLRRSLDKLLEIFPELKTDAGKDWIKMRKFTPDHVIDSKYFDWESDKPETHLAVRSGMGTGKTWHVHNKFLADDNIGANAFGYRNALLLQFCEGAEGTPGRKDWYHLQQDLKQSKDDLLLVADPQSRIAACVDSIIYFQSQHFAKKRLVLDEIEGSFKHLYESKTAVSFHRHLCKQRTGEAIANSEAVALLDGNLTDLTVAHAERISGKKFIKIENLYKGNRGKVTFYTGTLKVRKDEESGELVVAERRINDYSLLHKMMMENNEPFICGSDSQEKLESWDELLKAKGRKTFRLDGTNSNTPEAKKFLRNPQKYIIENKIQALLYSPTAESGLSIDLVGYFKKCFFFFFGVVLTNEQTQFLARLRDPNSHIYVYCQNQHQKSGSPDLVAEEMQKFFVEYALACSQISLSNIGEEEKQRQLMKLAADLVQKSNDAHFQYECHLQAKKVFEANHLRKCLEYALRDAGYKVETVTGWQASKKELDQAKELIQIKSSKEIFEARSLTTEEAQEKARNFDATRSDKIEITKHRIISRLPGIEEKTEIHTKIVTLPAEAVKEIEQGRVSQEIAQELGIPMPKMQDTQALELGHLPQNSFSNQGEGAPIQGELLVQRTDETIGTIEVNPKVELNQNKNLGLSKAEMSNAQALQLGHLPPNFSIKPVEGAPKSQNDQIQIEVTYPRPVFDADFIRKIQFQDRELISKVELHFLLDHPEIAKLIQQKKWYKKLQVFSDVNQADCTKNINLTTYRSNWLKIHTLLEMGIGFFLRPGASWTKDTPEVLSFWEKGKNSQIAKYIGTAAGDAKPCEYIGRVLQKLDIRTKSKKARLNNGEQIRLYELNQEYLASPMRSAIYQCVQERITTDIQSQSFVLDWDGILEQQLESKVQELESQAIATTELAQELGIPKAEMHGTQELQLGHLPQNSFSDQGEDAPINEENLNEMAIENLQAIASDLANEELCPNKEVLAEIRKCWSANVLSAACKFLSQERRAQIKKWVVELNQLITPLEEYSEDEISSRVEFLAQCDAEHERMMAKMNRESKAGCKLQPVEVLQAGLLNGWLKNYWVSAKYVLKNLTGQIRYWALFDEEGERWDFFGEVRLVTH